jgi:6-phosphogluconolactonase (cycloisomerase 2 family)
MGTRTCPVAVLCLALGATLLMWAVGCGSGPTHTTPQNTYVYVAQGEFQPGAQSTAGSIAQLQVNTDDSLTSLQPASVATSNIPTSLAVHPSGKFLLVSSSVGVVEYLIGQDGTLTPQQSPPVITGIPAMFTPDGRFVLAPGLGSGGLPSNTIAVYSFASDGTITSINASGTINDLGPIAVDPSSRFVYASSSTDNSIYEFSLSTTGTITPIGSVTANPAPLWLLVSPQGFLYALDNGAGGAVTVFQINPSNGTLIPGSTFIVCSAGENFPITFSPSGKYAYANCNGAVSQFSVGATTGAFTSNGSDLPNVGTITFDPSGTSAFAFTDPDTVSQFSVGEGGTLSLGGSFTLSTNPFMLGQSIASAQQ